MFLFVCLFHCFFPELKTQQKKVAIICNITFFYFVMLLLFVMSKVIFPELGDMRKMIEEGKVEERVEWIVA